MYYLFRLASRILPWIPRRFAYALGYILGLIAWLVAGKARRQATKNMIHVLGAQVQATRAGRRRLRRTVQGMFVHNTRNYLELFTLHSLSPEKILRNIDIKGWEHLNAALAQGKGVIIFAAHQGPFDYIVQYMGIKGYDVTIPVERLEDQRMLKLMLDLRRSHGVYCLPLTGSAPMRTIMQKLRDNKIVLIAADRVIDGKGVEANFFGAPARLPIGPIKLAQRTGAALIVGVNCYRTPQGLATGEWAPLSLELTGEQRTDTNTMLRALIEKFEDSIRKHPEQWVAFSPIWLEDIKNGS
jgi:lauroyl/myristoyl acyltransferase